MRLEEGMYVRFESVLCRIDEIVDNYISFDMEIYDHWNEPTFSMNYERFINDYKPIASHNIIDLIEVGDYVNGEKVIRIYEKGECYDGSNYGLITKTIETENDNYETIPHNHLYVGYSIKSIVTKEQFESVQYKVERVNYEI